MNVSPHTGWRGTNLGHTLPPFCCWQQQLFPNGKQCAIATIAPSVNSFKREQIEAKASIKMAKGAGSGSDIGAGWRQGCWQQLRLLCSLCRGETSWPCPPVQQALPSLLSFPTLLSTTLKWFLYGQKIDFQLVFPFLVPAQSTRTKRKGCAIWITKASESVTALITAGMT